MSFFDDGQLHRWKNNVEGAVENREWWEIESLPLENIAQAGAADDVLGVEA